MLQWRNWPCFTRATFTMYKYYAPYVFVWKPRQLQTCLQHADITGTSWWPNKWRSDPITWVNNRKVVNHFDCLPTNCIQIKRSASITVLTYHCVSVALVYRQCGHAWTPVLTCPLCFYCRFIPSPLLKYGLLCTVNIAINDVRYNRVARVILSVLLNIDCVYSHVVDLNPR